MDKRKSEAISLADTLRLILSDIARYRVTEKRSLPAIMVMSPGLIAGIYYRIGSWIWRYEGPAASLVALLRPFYIVGKRLIEIYSGISLSPRARIGKGFYINHFGSIFIGAVSIGDNCNISHEVTMGVAGRGQSKGLPTIGNRVYIAPGAKLIGKIEVGDDVAIGANSVVTKSIPDCAVVAGAPATVISYRGSFDFIIYDTMHTDPERLANLEHSLRESANASRNHLSRTPTPTRISQL
jgi:serine O-acetyltransferase